MRFVHNVAVVAALSAATLSWSCNGRGLAPVASGEIKRVKPCCESLVVPVSVS